MQTDGLKIKPYRQRCYRLTQCHVKGLSSLEITCVNSFLLNQLLKGRPEGVFLTAGCSTVDIVLF